ncbi:MAG: GTPase Era [Coriobacteriia bacterium]|nr:GTPase Era [Coriobacteriia bacterium]
MVTSDAHGVTKVFHSGFAALVGRPNAGKSTLTNALVGEKVAITSDRAQTTRHRLRAILNLPDAQVILVDTPGLHKPHDALGEEVNRAAYKAIEDVDVLCFLVDATQPVGAGDRWVAELLAGADAKIPRLAVLTKCDLATPDRIAAQRAAVAELADFAAILETAAPTSAGLAEFVEAVAATLPEGPRWFPEGMTTDQSLEVMVAEFIREKALRLTFDEVPHAIGVALDDLEQTPDGALTRISAVIYVEQESQKGIVVGKGGAQIKRIGSEARVDLERLLGTKVFLDLRVKVKKNWRRDAAQIRRFGYGD